MKPAYLCLLVGGALACAEHQSPAIGTYTLTRIGQDALPARDTLPEPASIVRHVASGTLVLEADYQFTLEYALFESFTTSTMVTLPHTEILAGSWNQQGDELILRSGQLELIASWTPSSVMLGSLTWPAARREWVFSRY